MRKNKLLVRITGVCLAVLGTISVASAAQVVAPRSVPSATGGVEFNQTNQKASVPTNGTLTVYGVYTDDSGSPESGIGLKVRYDATKLTNVLISEEYTKCRIAPAQKQDTDAFAGVNARYVMGYIDTSVRSGGAVGWPDLADTAAGGATTACLNPGSINSETAAASATSGLKLFKMTAQWVSGTAQNAETTITFDPDGNFSYANANPGAAPKSFNVIAAAPAICNLDVDNNGAVTPFRDGLLIFRHLNGLSGASLAAGIPGNPDTAAVASRIEAIRASLDVDGNGSVSPFRDGLLLFRMMSGLSGNALIQGIPLTGSSRTSPQDLVNYVNTTCGTSFAP